MSFRLAALGGSTWTPPTRDGAPKEQLSRKGGTKTSNLPKRPGSDRTLRTVLGGGPVSRAFLSEAPINFRGHIDLRHHADRSEQYPGEAVADLARHAAARDTCLVFFEHELCPTPLLASSPDAEDRSAEVPWFVGQHGVGSHRVGFVADQPLVDVVSARTVGTEYGSGCRGGADRRETVAGHPDGALPAPAAVARISARRTGCGAGSRGSPTGRSCSWHPRARGWQSPGAGPRRRRGSSQRDRRRSR